MITAVGSNREAWHVGAVLQLTVLVGPCIVIEGTATALSRAAEGGWSHHSRSLLTVALGALPVRDLESNYVCDDKQH